MVLEKLGFKVVNINLTNYLDKKDIEYKQKMLEKLVDNALNK